MRLVDSALHIGGKLFIEMPAARRSFTDLQKDLALGRSVILERAIKAGDTDYHRKVLNHIIGIERWGQSRLKVFLGEPFIRDEYDGYRPPSETSYPDLQRQFDETRQTTLHLIARLTTTPVDPSLRSIHNMFGPLTPRGWLYYLYFHANAESMRLFRSMNR
jgi:hypothetical protein